MELNSVVNSIHARLTGRGILTAVVIVMVSSAVPAQSQSATTGGNVAGAKASACPVNNVDDANSKPVPVTIKDDMDINTGVLLTANAPSLIDHLLAANPAYTKTNFPALASANAAEQQAKIKSASFIIHIVRWADSTPGSNGGGTTQTVKNQSWYVYTKGKLSLVKRLYGTGNFSFIYLHLNVKTTYESEYDLAITKTTPLPLQDLNTLLTFAAGGQQNLSEALALDASRGSNLANAKWGGSEIQTDCVPSDIVITPKVASNPAQSPGGAANSTDAFSAAQTFHDEAGSWWDVSVAFPVTSINQVSFNSSSNGLVPANIDKKSLYGALNLYPIPAQRMQIAKSGFSWYPSVIVGIPLSGQPLHKPLFGVSWGPPLAQFYVGAIVVKQPTATSAVAPVQSACSGWCPQFSFGIDFGVKALSSKVTSK
jgi:hypothetical protein